MGVDAARRARAAGVIKPMDHEQTTKLLTEYRAEVQALRTLLRLLERTKKRTAALIECRIVDGYARWIVTAPTVGAERLIADAVGEHIARQVGEAFKLVDIVMTGSSREENPDGNQEEPRTI